VEKQVAIKLITIPNFVLASEAIGRRVANSLVAEKLESEKSSVIARADLKAFPDHVPTFTISNRHELFSIFTIKFK
jgi:hypothetical protein